MRTLLSLVLLVVLAAVWALWSGHYTTLLLGLGAASCIFVVAVQRRMGIVDEEAVPLRPAPRALLYLPWLLWEIVKSNLDVSRRILDPRLPIRPHLIHAPSTQRSDLGRVIYANSITLTPGTVSVGLDEGGIAVHALTDEAAAGVLAGEMDRRCTVVEGRP